MDLPELLRIQLVDQLLERLADRASPWPVTTRVYLLSAWK